MRRRNYEIEVIQILMSIAIIIMTVILFIRSSELTVLFPVVFGMSAVLSVLYALEGVAYSRIRVIKKSRIVVFGIVALLLTGMTFVSAKIVL